MCTYVTSEKYMFMFTPYFHENRPLNGQGVEKVQEHERLLTLVLDLLAVLCMLWEMTVKQTHVFKRKRELFTATNEKKLSLITSFYFLVK